jgi:hypothetical protein
MVSKAKPWIIACGTFGWHVDDAGDKVPSIEKIVARCFAQACKEQNQCFLLQTEHILCVSTHLFYGLATDSTMCQVKILVTTYRHVVKQIIVALVDKSIGFVPGDKRFNRRLVKWLLPDAFHEAVSLFLSSTTSKCCHLCCRTLKRTATDTPFESQFMFDAVARTLFGPGKLGRVHAARFDPIPLRLIAFLCAVVSY